MKYRHEQKYICNQKDKALLQSRLRHLMRLDPNTRGGESYHIKSIYFDDCFNSCMYENEGGLDDRQKYRIRAYDNNPEMIKMEIKHKKSGMTNKESCRISRNIMERLVYHNEYPFFQDAPPVYNMFCLQHKLRLLKPVCIIGYQRTAYVLKEGNVRITFDESIYASSDILHFFDSSHRVPVLPTGQFVLEVKYDEFLPVQIERALGIQTLAQTSFSKYYLGRNALNGTLTF